MPRGGPGSAAPRKLPSGWPRTDPFLVWSYIEGAWWRVDCALSLDAARDAADTRQINVTAGTNGNAHNGTRPIKPRAGAQFVATARDGDPQSQWEATHWYLALVAAEVRL
jgi:hypothetical protein